MDNKERVLEYLKTNPHSTSREIAKALGLHRSTVSRHLKSLDGLSLASSRQIKISGRTRWLSRHGYTIEYWVNILKIRKENQ